MSTVKIFDKTFSIPSKIISFYDERICASFADMAELYLKADGVSKQEVSQFSDDELLTAVEPWVLMECDVLGVNYEDLRKL